MPRRRNLFERALRAAKQRWRARRLLLQGVTEEIAAAVEFLGEGGGAWPCAPKASAKTA